MADMTVAQILTNVRNQYAETSTAWVGDAEVYEYLWHGQIELNNKVGPFELSDQSVLSDGTAQEYSMPVGVNVITRLTWNRVKLKRIGFTDQDALDFPSYGNDNLTGNATHYYVYSSGFGLYPIPTTSNTVSINYIGQPAVVSGATALSIPDMFSYYLVDYCLYRMYLKDQDETKFSIHKGMWDEHIKESYTLWRKRNQADRYSVVRQEDNYPETELGII